MATSGTISQTAFTTRDIIDSAFRYCRLAPQQVTAEMLAEALKALYKLLSALPANVYPLWAQDHQLVALPLGKMAIDMPAGTIDLKETFLRAITRYDSTAVASSGVGYLAIDADLDTSCLQSSADGNLILDCAASVSVTMVGVALASSTSATLVIESSSDLLTWTSRWAPGRAAYVADEIVWAELDPSVDAQYWRLTGSGGETLDIAEFIVGTHRDRPLARRNRTQYVRKTNRQSRGTPNEFWLDRQHDIPRMWVYPTADATSQFSCISIWRQRYIEDVGSMTQIIEVPKRWYEAVTGALAWRIAISITQVDISVVNLLKPLADQWNVMIASDERESTPLQMSFNLRGYSGRR